MSRWRFRVEYDGTDFSGWQRQAGRRTVQGVLEETLSRLLCRGVRCTGAGRTDAGVHAAGQVAHVDLVNDGAAEEDRLLSGLPGMLPGDVSVDSFLRVPDDFHARFSAVRRTYTYRLSSARHALAARFVHCIPGLELDVASIERACRLSVGGRDWRGLAREGGGNLSWDVHVMDAAVSVDESSEGWTFVITANRFLRGMVRLWVGTLLEVGLGKLSLADFTRILDSGDRAPRGQSVPARGLCLTSVEYDAEPRMEEEA